MEIETQCCGMLHVFRLNLEDNPSFRTYSAYIKDISIPVCYNAPPPPTASPREGEGEGEWALLATGQITQSISSEGRDGGGIGTSADTEKTGGKGTEAGGKTPALDG